MDRNSLFRWVKETYGTEPDYPWSDDGAVLRHRENKKWYGLVMRVRGDRLGLPNAMSVDVLNIKCDPMLIGSLREQDGFFPAYHMNKNSWITILLDEHTPEDEVKKLIDLSFELTAPKKLRGKE